MSRRNRGRFWMPRASSFNNSSDSDDFPLAVFLARQAAARKKKTTTKRPSPRKTRQAARRAQPPVAVIDLNCPSTETANSPGLALDLADPDFEPAVVDRAVKSKVGSKVNSFFKSGRFLSSDEEDAGDEPPKLPPPVTTASTEISLTDDSDVEVCAPVKKSPVEYIPSTSTASEVQQAAEPKPEVIPVDQNDNDSFMDYVDSVLSGCDGGSKPMTEDTAVNDMKSLADFSKETEEMLKGASSLLDELRGTKKQQEEEQKKTEEAKPPPAPGPETPPVASCPICYEPYSAVAAAATICGHIFCKQCITTACKTSKKCPTCRKPLNLKKIHPIYFN